MSTLILLARTFVAASVAAAKAVVEEAFRTEIPIRFDP